MLEDNGGDDLIVSNDGRFTFGTKIAGGGAYDVKVKTAPAGQRCTVSHGTGAVDGADVTDVAVTCAASPVPTPGQDDFDRADGDLGSGWSAMSDGGLSVASQQILGAAGPHHAGDIRTAETYGDDQYSRIEVTSTQLSGGEWLGAAVRAQNEGQDMYLGIYFWNYGKPQLQLYKRTAGTFIQLGPSRECGPLSPGTKLIVSAVGSEISLMENGMAMISVTDTTLTGGAPGVMTYDAATGDNWAGGTATASTTPAGFQIQRSGTDANGVQYYDFTSDDDGYGTHVVRVLQPTRPAAGVPHNFLYVLPVDPEMGTTYGDGIDTMLSQEAQNKYNLTIIEPSFPVDPWYADNPDDASLSFETFMTQDLVPWVTHKFSEPATSGSTDPFTPLAGPEQNWLIGFSKSGIGAQDLLFKHPDVFAAAASWDFPADMSSYDEYGASSADNYGTDANFQANYRLTTAFLQAHDAPFQSQNRIWIGGYEAFQSDVADYDKLLSTEGILHSIEDPQEQAHGWDSGWVPTALTALSQDSAALSAIPGALSAP